MEKPTVKERFIARLGRALSQGKREVETAEEPDWCIECQAPARENCEYH